MERGAAERGFSQRHFPFPAHLPEGAPLPTPSSSLVLAPARLPSGAPRPRPHCLVPAYGPLPGHLPAPTLLRASQGAFGRRQQAKLPENSLRKKRASEPSARATPPTPAPEPGTAPSSALTGFRALPTSGLGNPDLRFEGGVPIPSHPAPFPGASWSPGST